MGDGSVLCEALPTLAKWVSSLDAKRFRRDHRKPVHGLNDRRQRAPSMSPRGGAEDLVDDCCHELEPLSQSECSSTHELAVVAWTCDCVYLKYFPLWVSKQCSLRRPRRRVSQDSLQQW